MSDPAPQALVDYVAGLRNHDIRKISNAVAEDVQFISATRILDKPQFIALLRALYTGFPDWHYQYAGIEDRGEGNYAIKWHQSGSHTGVLTLPGMEPIAPTAKRVKMPPQYFYYRIRDNKLSMIFPEPIVGGAPRGILEQIGVSVPPL
jgi:hypothetical protein